MKTTEKRVKILTDEINKVARELDEDYTQLSETGMSEDLLDNLLSETLINEIDKLVLLFEALNPDVFITGIQRLENEEGEMIVNLYWDHIGGS